MSETTQAQAKQNYKDSKKVLTFATDVGEILLENGAEISRVEETVSRICTYYGVETEQFFVLSNGIFATGEYADSASYAHVKHIPVCGPQLEKVIAVNKLSREIECGKYTVDEARAELEQIRKLKPFSFFKQTIASGIGSACFCMLFGGSLSDAVAAFIAGFLMYAYYLKFAVNHFSKIVCVISSGIVLSAICVLCKTMGIGSNMNYMIIGSVIPLVPGVPITNGVRDIADGDYLSGFVRLSDAILTFISIAIGVGIVLSVWNAIFGGAV